MEVALDPSLNSVIAKKNYYTEEIKKIGKDKSLLQQINKRNKELQSSQSEEKRNQLRDEIKGLEDKRNQLRDFKRLKRELGRVEKIALDAGKWMITTKVVMIIDEEIIVPVVAFSAE